MMSALFVDALVNGDFDGIRRCLKADLTTMERFAKRTL
jgi:hypothetical protein